MFGYLGYGTMTNEFALSGDQITHSYDLSKSRVATRPRNSLGFLGFLLVRLQRGTKSRFTLGIPCKASYELRPSKT